MSRKGLVVLTAILSNLGTISATWAAAVHRCDLTGVNPALHRAIFGKKHPDAAKAYGSVKLSGEGGKHVIWGLDPSVCGHTLSSL